MYIIDFDVVAVAISVISLYVYYLKKRVTTSRARHFEVLLWFVFYSSVFGVASSLAINALRPGNGFLVILTTTAFYLVHTSIPAIAALYVLTICGWHVKSRLIETLFSVPWALSIGLIVYNLVSGIMFSVDGGLYRHGPLRFILYVVVFVYLLIILYSVFIRERRLTRAQELAFASAIAFPVLSVIMQFMLSGLMLECFAISMSVLFITLTIQNSTELLDGQTGLFNRNAFMQFIDQAFDDRKKFSVLVVFSREMSGLQNLVNVLTYGQIVHSFASWLEQTAGHDAQVCMLGEGLFAIILKKETALGIDGEIALKIVERANDPWNAGPLRVELPAIVGIFRCPDDGRDVPELSDLIDQLSEMPEQIGNRHVFHKADFIPDKRRRDVQIAYEISDRMARGSLEIGYQGIHSVRDNRIVAAEALLRLTLDTGDVVKQSELLAVSERFGLSQKLSAYVFDRAFYWYTRSGALDRGIDQIQIRLNESQCVDLDWPKVVVEAAKAHGMDLRHVCLEITEPSVVHSGPSLSLNMARLAGQGVKFALDDYGSGYTYLGQIIDMPFSIIKIDKRVVRAGMTNRKGRHLLLGSISLFRRLGNKVVAEGIETAEQAEIVSAMGCEYLQGYYFGHTVSGAELLDR